MFSALSIKAGSIILLCFFKRSLSNEPEFTPNLIGILFSFADFRINLILSLFFIFPGFNRSPSTPN